MHVLHGDGVGWAADWLVKAGGMKSGHPNGRRVRTDGWVLGMQMSVHSCGC